MGLDMYAYTAPKELIGDAQVDVNDRLFQEYEPVAGVDTGFAYWRKFNALHGWMRDLYFQKNGAGMDFNCNTVRLMPEDLDQLERDIDSLEPVEGFFFGSQDPVTDDEKQEVRDFIAKARQAIEENKAVIYDSWW